MHLCFEMNFLTKQFKEYLCFEIHFLREQFWKTVFFKRAIYILKCMKNLFKIYGCRLVWLLLYIFMAAEYYDCWSIFFMKVFTTSKNFCNVDMYKYKFKMYKRLWITVNQTNRWAGSVFQGSVWSPANFKE